MSTRDELRAYLDLDSLRNLESFQRSRNLSEIQPEIVALLEAFRTDWPEDMTLEQIAMNFGSADAALVARIEIALAILTRRPMNAEKVAHLRLVAASGKSVGAPQ